MASQETGNPTPDEMGSEILPETTDKETENLNDEETNASASNKDFTDEPMDVDNSEFSGEADFVASHLEDPNATDNLPSTQDIINPSTSEDLFSLIASEAIQEKTLSNQEDNTSKCQNIDRNIAEDLLPDEDEVMKELLSDESKKSKDIDLERLVSSDSNRSTVEDSQSNINKESELKENLEPELNTECEAEVGKEADAKVIEVSETETAKEAPMETMEETASEITEAEIDKQADAKVIEVSETETAKGATVEPMEETGSEITEATQGLAIETNEGLVTEANMESDLDFSMESKSNKESEVDLIKESDVNKENVNNVEVCKELETEVNKVSEPEICKESDAAVQKKTDAKRNKKTNFELNKEREMEFERMIRDSLNEEGQRATRTTLFVNSDSNVDDSAENEVPLESDPIGSNDENLEILPVTSDDNQKDCMINEDDVTDKSSSSDEKYTINKCNERNDKQCMVCNRVRKASYSCSYKTVSYICNDECFEKFKKQKHGKYHVMQTIRVKSFNTITSGDDDEETIDDKCKSCMKVVDDTNCISLLTRLFCNVACLKDYYKKYCSTCFICEKSIAAELIGKYWIRFGLKLNPFCSFDCFSKYRKPERGYCKFCFNKLYSEYDDYCDELCGSKYEKLNVINECSVCHNNKPIEIVFINDDDKSNYFCGEPCFVAYKFVNKVDPKQCEICRSYKQSDKMRENSIKDSKAIVHSICSEKCRRVFILTKYKSVNCHACSTKKNCFDSIKKGSNYYCSLYCYERQFIKKATCHNCKKLSSTLVKQRNLNFCSVYCFNSYEMNLIEDNLSSTLCTVINAQYYDYNEDGTTNKVPFQEMIYLKPPEIVRQRNVATMVHPNMANKSVSCKPKESSKGIQTDKPAINTFVIPIPVPIYVPTPVHMLVDLYPLPFPVPIPIPVPILVPTNRNSAKGILKEIAKVKNKIPADPLEAELLMMADMVAEDKKDESNSDSDDDEPESFAEPPTNFGDDVLQMALKLANDFEEPVDLEGAVSVSTIGPSTSQHQSMSSYEPVKKRGRPRVVKKPARTDVVPVLVNQPTTPTQKPDANLCLKFTFGVNAWKQWVTIKNSELEKTSKKPKLFKTDILQLTSDELNFSLCLFVKEVRKPNGTEYAPDTIYYLCLGIQQFLYENNRIDNIFCDAFYEKFTECLNEVCKKFSMLYNESQYIVTRVEEEHLWESKQLGAHSPLVLLNTLMFFNTKHFSLTTVEEHLQLSFSHIMKHWKRNPNQPGARSVLLRFYPPQNAQIENRKKKMYEQQENEDNPIRCPVKLYEFYLSKCPESVKTRNDVFYLLPERSCVPDSPLWYSTMALDEKSLDKMLNRVKMVKEINIALLSG